DQLGDIPGNARAALDPHGAALAKIILHIDNNQCGTHTDTLTRRCFAPPGRSGCRVVNVEDDATTVRPRRPDSRPDRSARSPTGPHWGFHAHRFQRVLVMT